MLYYINIYWYLYYYYYYYYYIYIYILPGYVFKQGSAPVSFQEVKA